jgi:hypothetical protein
MDHLAPSVSRMRCLILGGKRQCDLPQEGPSHPRDLPAFTTVFRYGRYVPDACSVVQSGRGIWFVDSFTQDPENCGVLIRHCSTFWRQGCPGRRLFARWWGYGFLPHTTDTDITDRNRCCHRNVAEAEHVALLSGMNSCHFSFRRAHNAKASRRVA